MGLSLFIFMGAFVLGLGKYLIAKRLNSYTLHVDAITSFFVSLLAVVYIVCATIYHYVPDTWMAEHIVAVAAAFGLLTYATFNLFRTDYAGYKFYHTEFWM